MVKSRRSFYGKQIKNSFRGFELLEQVLIPNVDKPQ